MRRSILTDESGRILATLSHPEDAALPAPGGPQLLGFAPLGGQRVHSVNLSEEFASVVSLKTIHQTHRVEIRDHVAYLVKA